MSSIQERREAIYKSAEIRRILRALGWKDYRLDHPERRNLRKAGPRVNGVPWKIARLLITRDADDHGIELEEGQLGRVVRLEAAGYFRDHLESEE